MGYSDWTQSGRGKADMSVSSTANMKLPLYKLCKKVVTFGNPPTTPSLPPVHTQQRLELGPLHRSITLQTQLRVLHRHPNLMIYLKTYSFG